MFLPRKTNTTLDKILDLSWRRIPISRSIRRGALSFRVKPIFFLYGIRMSWFQNHTAWPKLKQWLSQMKLIWPHVAATLLIFHNRYNGKFEGRLAQRASDIKKNAPKLADWASWKLALVKFPHSQHKSVFPMAMSCFCHYFFYPRTECKM